MRVGSAVVKAKIAAQGWCKERCHPDRGSLKGDFCREKDAERTGATASALNDFRRRIIVATEEAQFIGQLVIDSDAVGIECSRVRKTRIESSDSISQVIRQIGTWERKSIEVWLHRGTGRLTCLSIRHRSLSNLWQPEPESFVREKEEGSASDDRATNSPTEVVLTFLGLGQLVAISEPVVCVQHVVPKVVKYCPVKLIRPRARHD